MTEPTTDPRTAIPAAAVGQLLAVSVVETAAALVGTWQITSYAERRISEPGQTGTDVEATR